ncbi:hypothetical protein ACJX0J_008671, partial [Zea mays]
RAQLGEIFELDRATLKSDGEHLLNLTPPLEHHLFLINSKLRFCFQVTSQIYTEDIQCPTPRL